jgi:hypothetical protein
MSSHAKTVIDALRKTAIGLGITSTLSRDRDLCARLLYGRPYASVLPAEKAGSLGPPSILLSNASTLVEKHGPSGQQLLHAAELLVGQEAGRSFDTEKTSQDRHVHRQKNKPHDPTDRTAASTTIETLLDQHVPQQQSEGNNMELKKASVDIDYIACKSSGILSDTLAERIQTSGAAIGYEVKVNFVDSGGDFTNPIAVVRASGAPESEVACAIKDVTALAQEAFKGLRDHAKASSGEHASKPLLAEDAFQRDAVTRWKKLDAATYIFALKNIPTDIRVVLTPNRDRKGFNFHLSHVIHTPAQIGPYYPGIPWGDDLPYALSQAVSAITMFYDTAVEKGHKPSMEWLVPNGA